MNQLAILFLCGTAAASTAWTGARSFTQDETPADGQFAVTRPGLIKSLLGTLEESEANGAWLGGDEPMADAGILLAFFCSGHTVTRGSHKECVGRAAAKFMRRFSQDLGSPFERGEENDLGHAWALCIAAELFILEEHKGTGQRMRAAAKEAFKRQGKDGLWGSSNEEVEATCRMLLGLSLAQDSGLRISDKRFEGTFASMEAWVDAKTGAFEKQGEMTDEDVLLRTSASVMAMLCAGRDPSDSQELAKSIEWLTKTLGDPKVAKHWGPTTANPAFWEWTSYVAAQLFERGSEELNAWSVAGVHGMGRDAKHLIEGDSRLDAVHAASIVRAISAYFSYSPGDFAPAKTDD